MNKRLKERLKSDGGNAVLIMSLAIFGLILLIAVFLVDASKNVQLQNTYTQMAQRATQIGLKKQNYIGGLSPESVDAVINEYLEERDPTQMCDGKACQTNETKAFRAVCDEAYPQYPEIKISYSTQRNNSTSQGNKGFNPDLVFTYSNGVLDKNPYSSEYSNLFSSLGLKVIKVEVTDVGDNYFSSLFGKQCSIYKTETSAIAINADELQKPK